LFQLEIEGLAGEFPPLSTREREKARPRIPRRRAEVQVATTPLLEREAEVAALHAVVDGAASGAGRVVAIEGRAGMGKTRLVAEARALATDVGFEVLVARSADLEQEFAFGVVRQLLEPAVHRFQNGLFTGAAAPATRLFEVDERPSVDGDGSFEALHSLFWLVVNLADQGPLLLLVDDCQWVDRESLRFLSFLAQRIEDLPVALLLAGRPPDSADEGAGVLWTRVVSRPATVALNPQPLSEPAVAGLTREQLGAEAADEFCRACHTASATVARYGVGSSARNQPGASRWKRSRTRSARSASSPGSEARSLSSAAANTEPRPNCAAGPGIPARNSEPASSPVMPVSRVR